MLKIKLTLIHKSNVHSVLTNRQIKKKKTGLKEETSVKFLNSNGVLVVCLEITKEHELIITMIIKD